MAYEIPDSMEELVYFSRRKFSEVRGSVIAWTRKLQCPKCKKSLMGKPVDPKTKKIMVRSTEYACPLCHYNEPKQMHEAKLNAEIIYQCPFCQNKGECTVPFARKSWYGKKAIVFQCAKCKEKLGITKKLATPPDFIAKLEGKAVRKGAGDDADNDDDDDF